MANHLSSGKVNLSILRESYRRELLECVDKCSGSKAIVWDDALTGPVGLIAEYSLLKEHEVDKMFPLRPGKLPYSNVQNVIFIVRPRLSLIDIIAENVHKEEHSGLPRKDFHIFFAPRKSLLCEIRLKELGVYGSFTNVDEYCIDLLPLDGDLLSMEMETSFKDCFLDEDRTSLYHIAKGLMVMQALYGIIPNIYGQGKCARHVVDILLRMRREMAGSESPLTPQIDNLLIFDRTVDPLTPLLSQLTYEGLIDEIFSINNTTVRLPADKFAANETKQQTGNGGVAPESSSDMRKIVLNSGEELYADLRDKNFNAVGPTLSKRAKMLTTQFDERHAAKTVGEIKQFVSKLPHMQAAKQALATHTTIAELVKEVISTDEFRENLSIQQEFIHGLETDKVNTFIEDLVARRENLNTVLRLMCIQSCANSGLKPKVLDHYKREIVQNTALRLMCIQSCANNGFKPKVLDNYKREIVQTYGYEHLLTLGNLEKAGLLRLQTTRTYPALRKALKLVTQEVNELNPTDISYVFSGYAPLSVRLAQALHHTGWRSLNDLLNMLPGPSIEEIQNLPPGLRKRRTSAASLNSLAAEQKVTLIFFVGGVTFAEISALRFLSHMDDAPADYIIGTTKIINGNTWIQSISTQLEAKPPNPF